MNRPLQVVLPYIEVRWNEAVVSTGTFVRYNVYRRAAGEAGNGIRIAALDTQTTLSYRDHTATSRTTWEYAVTQSVNVSGSVLESDLPDWVRGRVLFDWPYMHSVFDPTQYAQLPAFEIDTDVQQDIEFRKAWGRDRETAFIGEMDYDRMRLDLLPDKVRGKVWAELRALATLQGSEAAVFCLRIGVAEERYFVNIRSAGKRGGQGAYQPRVEVVETFFEEEV